MYHHGNYDRNGTRRVTGIYSGYHHRPTRQNRSVTRANRIRVRSPMHSVRSRARVVHTRRLVRLNLRSIRTSGHRSPNRRRVLKRLVNSRANDMGTRSRTYRPSRVSRSNPYRYRPRLQTCLLMRRLPRLLPTIPIRRTRNLQIGRASTSRRHSTSSTRGTTTRRPSRTNRRLKRSRLILVSQRHIRRMTFPTRRILVGTLSNIRRTRRHSNGSSQSVRSRRGRFRVLRTYTIDRHIFLPRNRTRRRTRRHRHRVRPRVPTFHNLRLVFRRLFRRLGASQGCTSALLPSISQVSSATQ